MGRPSENLPRPGAVRIYSDPKMWEQTVIDAMQAAQLVVIRAESSQSLFWELRKARELVEPRRLLLLILEQGKYYEFRPELEALLNVRLPFLSSYRQQGFFRFNSDWTTEFLPLKSHFLRGSFSRPLQRSIQFALKPVFTDHGVDWTTPKISPLTLLARLVIVLAVITVLLPTPPVLSYDEQQIGACLIFSDGGVDKSPCDDPHDGEIFASVELHEQTRPSSTRLDEIGEQACAARFEEYVGIPWEDSTLDIFWVGPSGATWAVGDHTLMCVLVMSNDQRLVGSMKAAHQ
jgi:hypothetical protein